MKYIITIKKEDGPSKGNENLVGITPEDTFHVYDEDGVFCSCCSVGDNHEYVFEEPEEVARWFVHRYCESIELAGGVITEIRDDEYNPRQQDK